MISKRGYKKIKTDDGETVFRYIRNMEKALGRELRAEELVHHIDHDKTNDSIDNLYLCYNRKIHSSIHGQFNSLSIKIGKVLLKIGLITFDKKSGLYFFNEDKIDDLMILSEETKKDMVKSLEISPKEISKINKRRTRIINYKGPKMYSYDWCKNNPEYQQMLGKIEQIDKKIIFKKIKEM